jgi:hypothetical protein
MSDFWLQKWYLDAADPYGNVYIGYRAQVRWRGIGLHFHQHLFRTAARGVWTQSGLARLAAPAWHAPGELRWNAAGVRGVWQAAGPAPIEETLLATDAGTIRWRCHQPKARACIKSAELSFAGWGYSECIEITIPAWSLPLQTLYWGRAHSESHHMVWIQWQGETAHSRLWHDGAREIEFAVAESGVSGRTATLMVDENVTLRQGTVRSTVFGQYEAVAARFPARALLFDEHKWYGRGTLFAEGAVEPATVIHEVVTW